MRKLVQSLVASVKRSVRVAKPARVKHSYRPTLDGMEERMAPTLFMGAGPPAGWNPWLPQPTMSQFTNAMRPIDVALFGNGYSLPPYAQVPQLNFSGYGGFAGSYGGYGSGYGTPVFGFGVGQAYASPFALPAPTPNWGSAMFGGLGFLKSWG